MVILHTLSQDIYVRKPVTCEDTDVTLRLIPTNHKYGNYDVREVHLKSQTDDYWVFDGEREFQRSGYDDYTDFEAKYMVFLGDKAVTQGVMRLKDSTMGVADYKRKSAEDTCGYTVYKYPRNEHY